MKRESFDAAVIGGGPAGCAAAIDLAKSGAQVALFEAQHYPHDKLCGEFLSPECYALFDALGVTSQLHALRPVHIHDIRITSPDGVAWNSSFAAAQGTARNKAPALGLTRSALDAMLADHARSVGVGVCEGATVKGVTGNLASGFELSVRQGSRDVPIRARTVIAAHGKRASLDRALDRRFLQSNQPFVALKAHFRGPAVPQRIELHGFPGGYCGMSEIENGLVNVCLLVHEQVMQHTRRTGEQPVASFIRWMQEQNPALAQWMRSAKRVNEDWLSIAQVPFVEKEPVLRDILLAGDAAGLIVPLAGDGIAMALQSGRKAARHVQSYLAGRLSPVTLTERYAASWRQAFGPRLRLGRGLQILMLRPRLLSLGLRLLIASPRLGRLVVEHTRDLNVLSTHQEKEFRP